MFLQTKHSTATPLHRLIARTVLYICLLGLAAPSLANDFYDERLEEGKRSLESGAFQEALTSLRLACFGKLEDSSSLAECKSLLFVALVGNQNAAEASKVLMQVASLEQTSGALSKSELDPALRSRFLSTVLDSFPGLQFQQSPRFAALVEEARAQQQVQPVAPIDPASIAELQGRSEANPDDLDLRTQLALRLYSEEKVVDALQVAEAVALEDPANHEARCIQATVSSARNRDLCSLLIDEVEQCPESLWTQFHLETRLRCYTLTDEWNRGRDFLATVAPDQLQRGAVRKLANKIDKKADPIPSEPSEQLDTTVADHTQLPDSQLPTSGEETSSANGDQGNSETEGLAEVRLKAQGVWATAQRAHEARSLDLLDEALVEAIELAEANPSSFEAQKVAGEVACLASRWTEAVRFLVAASELRDLNATSLFYLSVGYHETGEAESASQVLQQSLDRGLVRNPTVDRYREKILGTGQ